MWEHIQNLNENLFLNRHRFWRMVSCLWLAPFLAIMCFIGIVYTSWTGELVD